MALLSNVIQSGTRASQPAATAVAAGVLYFVTDEGELERSTGSAWVQVAVNETGHDALDHTGLTGVGGGGINSGTSFPGTPANNDLFYRTDLDLLCFYDGTRWLTVTQYEMVIPGFPTSIISATATSHRVAIPQAGVFAVWAVDFWVSFFVSGGTALGASHKWVLTLAHQPAGTTIATVNIASGASDTWRTSGATAIDASIATTQFELEVTSTKTGTPGNLFAFPILTHRLVIT